jgi:hypothetical protein
MISCSHMADAGGSTRPEQSGMVHAPPIAEALLMMLLFLIVFLLIGALVSLLGWPPETKWHYASTAACGVLAVVIALVICWSPP